MHHVRARIACYCQVVFFRIAHPDLSPPPPASNHKMTPTVRVRFDLRLKSGELPPGEERGAIEITTQWFHKPSAAPVSEKKKVDFRVAKWLGPRDSDTSDTDVSTTSHRGRTFLVGRFGCGLRISYHFFVFFKYLRVALWVILRGALSRVPNRDGWSAEWWAIQGRAEVGV